MIPFIKFAFLSIVCILGSINTNSTFVELKKQTAQHYSNTVENEGDEKPTSTPDELKQLYALSACLMDADNGRVLFEKNGSKKMPMASTTKIMTCIVTLENADLEDIVTISSNASRQPDVQLNAREGEQFKLKDLLYSLMLESHNDVAVAIAEHVGGSVEGFATMMNRKAKELKCDNTNLVTPNGLDADNHYTTAVELSRIASYAIENKKFVEITNTPSWSFSTIKGDRSYTVNNKDAFLHQMTGAIGVKTGFTGKAGYCFVGALKQDGKTFISVVLACGWPPNKSYKWSDTKKLMNYGVENFDYATIFEGNHNFRVISVRDGIEAEIGTYTEGELRLLLKEEEQVEYQVKMPDVIEAPVYEDSTIGYISVLVNGEEYENYPIKVTKTVLKIDYPYWFDKILNRFLLGNSKK